MKSFLFFLIMISSSLNPLLSQPNLLERAKNNPREGSELCEKFEEYNSQNKSATSVAATEYVSKKKNFLFIIKPL